MKSVKYAILAVAASGVCLGAAAMPGFAQQPDDGEVSEETFIPPLDEEGRLVQFERDIAPILRSRCLECHGPDDAKNDFRVDDVDTLMQYVEPEDLESSLLYTDYLVVDDEDMVMPPTTHGGPLSATELALFRVWIAEGAVWPEGYELVVADEADASESAELGETSSATPLPPKTLAERLWAFQGFLHPATVHFPIALFLFGAMFVVLGWKWPAVGTQIPLACLLLGSLFALASTLMGWSFAPEQGYGNNWSRLDWDREIDVHRWSGVIVTVLSIVLAVLSLIALAKGSERLTSFWKFGLLVLAGMVGAVGHQGGEMSYGADFYPKAFRILLGTHDQMAVLEEVLPEDAEAALSSEEDLDSDAGDTQSAASTD